MDTKNAFRQTNAYGIFLTELRSHVEWVQELRERGIPDQAEYWLLQERLHKVHGSAGLFGLDAVGELAHTLEKALENGVATIDELSDDFRLFEQVALQIVQKEREKSDV